MENARVALMNAEFMSVESADEVLEDDKKVWVRQESFLLDR
jgi:hypothetical protein